MIKVLEEINLLKSFERNQLSLFHKILIAAFITFALSLPSYANSSGYYEVPKGDNLAGLDSACCCEKDLQNSNGKTAIYYCKQVESNDQDLTSTKVGQSSCPASSKLYNKSGDCPNNLIFTKV